MKNIKMWLKLGLGLGIVILLLVAISLMSLLGMNSINDEVTTLDSAFLPLQQSASVAQQSLVQIPGSMNAYLYTKDERFWNDTLKAIEDADKAITAVQSVVDSSDEIADTGRVVKMREAFLRQKTAIQDSRDTFVAELKALNDMNTMGRDMTLLVQKLYDLQKESLATAVQTNDPDASRLVQASDLSSSIKDTVQDLRIRMLRSVAEQNREYLADAFDSRFPALEKELGTAMETVVGLERQEIVAQLLDLEKQWKAAVSNYVVLWNKMDELLVSRDKARSEALSIGGEVNNRGQALQADGVAAIVKTVDGNILRTSIVSVFAVLFGIVVAVVLTKGITGPLSLAVGFARSVASGELNKRLNLKRNDEIGQLSVALDSMVESLNGKIAEAEEKSHHAIVKEQEAQHAMKQAEAASREAASKSQAMLDAADKLEEVAHIVSSASEQLSAQIEQSGHGAGEQARRMGETATAMNEMNATVLEVARNAANATDVSASAKLRAEQGAAVVEKSVVGIRKVRQDSLVLKEDMQTLSEHTQAISQIMGVISDIADQTNLLALNAAIEAARAGDAGRGFAVVADEVRNLAEKTMASTTDVSNAIKGIQSSAAKSMAQVDTAVSNIEEATEYANQSGSALEEIVGMVEHTADQVRAIATASEEQSAASEEINHSIGQVNVIAGETARAMSEASKAVSDLANQAQQLSTLIASMKRN